MHIITTYTIVLRLQYCEVSKKLEYRASRSLWILNHYLGNNEKVHNSQSPLQTAINIFK